MKNIKFSYVKKLSQLKAFYRENSLSEKFASHLFYRTKYGNIFLKKNNKIIGHICFGERSPWPIVYTICKLKINTLRKSKLKKKGKSIFNNLEIANLFIKPSERNKGYGKKLFQHALKKIEKNYKTIDLLVNPKNIKAVKLYKKQKFIFTKNVSHKKRMVKKLT